MYFLMVDVDNNNDNLYDYDLLYLGVGNTSSSFRMSIKECMYRNFDTYQDD